MSIKNLGATTYVYNIYPQKASLVKKLSKYPQKARYLRFSNMQIKAARYMLFKYAKYSEYCDIDNYEK